MPETLTHAARSVAKVDFPPNVRIYKSANRHDARPLLTTNARKLNGSSEQRGYFGEVVAHSIGLLYASVIRLAAFQRERERGNFLRFLYF